MLNVNFETAMWFPKRNNSGTTRSIHRGGLKKFETIINREEALKNEFQIGVDRFFPGDFTTQRNQSFWGPRSLSG